MDPDPRQRPDTDPAAGLRGLLAATPEAAAAVAAIEGSVTGAGGSGGGSDSLPGAAEAVLRVVVGQGPGGSSSRSVHKDDFAMGGVAMPALAGRLPCCLMACGGWWVQHRARKPGVVDFVHSAPTRSWQLSGKACWG